MALAGNKRVVLKEAEKIMGGQVLETETETVYREGVKEGHEKGVKEGHKEIDDLYSWLKSQNRNDDILRAVGDEALQNELLEEYHEANGKNS